MATKKTSTPSSKRKPYKSTARNKGNRRILRGLFILLALLGSIGIAIPIYLKSQIYPAHERALQAVAYSQVTETADYFKFDTPNERANIVFDGGAFVQVQSYGYLAEQLNQAGIDVYLVKSPFHLAVLNASKAREIIQQLQLEHVYLAGHSMGGAMNAQNARDIHVSGLILLAAYPGTQTDLSELNLPVLSITASQDQVLNQKRYQEAKKRLPKETTFLTIQGGNHAGFGLYGPQKGDGKATISALDQEDQVVAAMVEFVEKTVSRGHS